MTLPVVNPDDKDHYLPPTQARSHIESKNVTDNKLRSLIPNPKNDTEEKKVIKAAKKEGRAHKFDLTQV